MASIKERSKIHPYIRVGGAFVLAADLFLAACQRAVNAASPTNTLPNPVTRTELVTSNTPDFSRSGPEATPVPPAPSYPTSLSVNEILSLLDGEGPPPAGFIDDPDRAFYMNSRESWARAAGFNLDDATQADFVTFDIITWGNDEESFRWDGVLKDRNGEIAGWLQIRDENMETGWRYAKSPGYDGNFDPEHDELRFALPEKLNSENSFEIILWKTAFKILVELDSSGNPLRWLNTVSQEMVTATGAIIEAYRLEEDGNVMEFIGGEWKQVQAPGGMVGEVLLGETGTPQFKMDLPDRYGEPGEGVIIAERNKGQWRLTSFSLMRSPDYLAETLDPQNFSSYIYDIHEGVIDSLIYYFIKGELIGLNINVSPNNQTDLSWILAYRGRLFKMNPEIFLLTRNHGNDRTEYDSSNLTLGIVAMMINSLDIQVPHGNTRFDFGLDSVVGDQTYENVGLHCQAIGQKFDELCRVLVENEDRLVSSLGEMQSLANSYAFWPTGEQITNGDMLWNDELFKPLPDGVINSAILRLSSD